MAYVVINESTDIMLPVTYSVAHIMTIGIFLWFICIKLLRDNYSLLSALLLPYEKG